MGHKSKQKRPPERSRRSAGSPSIAPTSRSLGASLKRKWVFRICAAIFAPLLLLTFAEAALRISGYGYSARFFVPIGDGTRLATNPKFAWQFYPKSTATLPVPVSFPREKAAGTKRIFVLGESAAAGTPDPAFGFSRMLDLMLREQLPAQRFEVINAAMRGIDSHVIRSIAQECAALSPDLFIVYAGNNEMIGLHAPTPNQFVLTRNIHWLRFKQMLQRLKLMQAGQAMLETSKPEKKPEQNQEFFRQQRVAFDNSLREPNYQNFEKNVRDICALAEKAGARTLLCSVAVNLRDFPPLASLHRSDLPETQKGQWREHYTAGHAAEGARNWAKAIASYTSALDVDHHYAELHFRLARCLEATGHVEEARRHFALARDWDALQFRTDSRLNAITRDVAINAGASVTLVDIENLFAESALAENRLPGNKAFQEHVHFNFSGDHLLASSLLSATASAFDLSVTNASLSLAECARRLAYTVVDDFNVRSSVARLLSNPPFLDQLEQATRLSAMNSELQAMGQRIGTAHFAEAATIYREALAARPDDVLLRFNYANLLKEMGQREAAAPEFALVANQNPHWPAYRVAWANLLLELGKWREAATELEAVLKVNPEITSARQALIAARSRAR